MLKEAVDGQGRIVPAAARARESDLDAQLRRFAVTGPSATGELYPTPQDRLAYWYNVRAAWELKLALLADLPAVLPAGLQRRELPVDGRRLTLQDIDAIILGDHGWAALAAGPGASMQRARLPAAPFAPGDIDQQVRQRLSDLLADRRRLVIDIQRQRVAVPPVLWEHRQAIIGEYAARCHVADVNLLTALLPHATGSAHRRLQDAIGYRVGPAAQQPILAMLED